MTVLISLLLANPLRSLSKTETQNRDFTRLLLLLWDTGQCNNLVTLLCPSLGLTCEYIPEISISWNIFKNSAHEQQELQEFYTPTSIRVNLQTFSM